MHIIDRGALTSPAGGIVTPTTSRSGLPPEMLAAASERWDRGDASQWWRAHLPEMA